MAKSKYPFLRGAWLQEVLQGGPPWGSIVGVQIIIPPVDRRVDQVPCGCVDNNNSDHHCDGDRSLIIIRTQKVSQNNYCSKNLAFIIPVPH